MRGTIIALILAVVVLAVVGIGFRNLTTDTEIEERMGIAFECQDGTVFRAQYSEDAEAVTLYMHGRPQLKLKRSRSGSGARYADNRNEFWEHQGEAKVTLGDGTVWEGCKPD